MSRALQMSIALQDEFLSDIIGNASETSYSWFDFNLRQRKWQRPGHTSFRLNEAAMRDPKFIDGALCVSVPLSFDKADEDEGNMKGRYTLDFDSVTEGLRRIISGECKCGVAGDIAAAVAAQDAGMLDCNLCDAIVQAAVFNEIVYG